MDEFSGGRRGRVGKGCGWRTDYHIISEALKRKVEYATIYKTGSFPAICRWMIDGPDGSNVNGMDRWTGMDRTDRTGMDRPDRMDLTAKVPSAF